MLHITCYVLRVTCYAFKYVVPVEFSDLTEDAPLITYSTLGKVPLICHFKLQLSQSLDCNLDATIDRFIAKHKSSVCHSRHRFNKLHKYKRRYELEEFGIKWA